jgi:hypothetical protein
MMGASAREIRGAFLMGPIRAAFALGIMWVSIVEIMGCLVRAWVSFACSMLHAGSWTMPSSLL